MTYTFNDFMKQSRNRYRAQVTSFRVIDHEGRKIIDIETVGDREDQRIRETLDANAIDAEYEVLDSKPCRSLQPLVE